MRVLTDLLRGLAALTATVGAFVLIYAAVATAYVTTIRLHLNGPTVAFTALLTLFLGVILAILWRERNHPAVCRRTHRSN